jgi:hypothetical protein
MENYKKTEHFEAIAMKCNQEQFEEIKPILDKFNFNLGLVDYFGMYPYLFNNFKNYSSIAIVTNSDLKKVSNEIVYNEWNSEIFLKACGIEKTEKTYTLTETFVNELCKEPNIKEAFVREGIVEAIVEIPLKDILATPNDLKLGEMVRKLANEKL